MGELIISPLLDTETRIGSELRRNLIRDECMNGNMLGEDVCDEGPYIDIFRYFSSALVDNELVTIDITPLSQTNPNIIQIKTAT